LLNSKKPFAYGNQKKENICGDSPQKKTATKTKNHYKIKGKIKRKKTSKSLP